MKQLLPIGYQKTRMGREIAVFVIIISSVIMALLLNGGAVFSDLKPMLAGAIVLALLACMTDLISNKKNKEKISFANEMLSCPSTEGTVKEMRRINEYTKKEINENGKIFYSSSESLYKLTVVFYDPFDGQERSVESELYAMNPMHYIEDNRVRVHYKGSDRIFIGISKKPVKCKRDG